MKEKEKKAIKEILLAIFIICSGLNSINLLAYNYNLINHIYHIGWLDFIVMWIISFISLPLTFIFIKKSIRSLK